MNKKIVMITPIVLVLTISLFIHSNPIFLRFAYASSPDAFGNRIINVCISQWNTTDWVYDTTDFTYNGDAAESVADCTTHTLYNNNTGFSWRVHDAGAAVGTGCTYPITIRVVTYMNKTLAVDETEAETNNQVTLNITKNGGGYSLQTTSWDAEVGSSVNATYWKIIQTYNWNVTSHPATGDVYNVWLQYYAYW